MKLFYCSIITVLLLSIPPAPSTATETPALLVITDTISEMAPDGSFVQVGDYGINRIRSIVVSLSSLETVPGTVSDLAVGRMVAAKITDKDENGLWRAELLTVFPEAVHKEAPSAPATSSSSSQPGKPSKIETLKLRDGVWTN